QSAAQMKNLYVAHSLQQRFHLSIVGGATDSIQAFRTHSLPSSNCNISRATLHVGLDAAVWRISNRHDLVNARRYPARPRKASSACEKIAQASSPSGGPHLRTRRLSSAG